MVTTDDYAVLFGFMSREECEAELKTHKSSFSMFAGFNNRTSGFMIHPKRKPVYEIISRLMFATWNEYLRFDNDCCDVQARYLCDDIFKKCFRRKVQDLEFEKIFKAFNRIYKAALKSNNHVPFFKNVKKKSHDAKTDR